MCRAESPDDGFLHVVKGNRPYMVHLYARWLWSGVADENVCEDHDRFPSRLSWGYQTGRVVWVLAVEGDCLCRDGRRSIYVILQNYAVSFEDAVEDRLGW